jgi:outer membrane protein
MPNKIFYSFITLLLLLLFFVGYFYVKSSKKTIVYVDNVALFNGFQMTKELKGEGEKILSKKKQTLDSLQLQLSFKIAETDKGMVINKIIQQQQEVQKFENEYIQNNSEKIWKRISVYSKEFAEKNDYVLIIGSQYKGDVIYGNNTINVTNEMLNFINKKYEGL